MPQSELRAHGLAAPERSPATPGGPGQVWADLGGWPLNAPPAHTASGASELRVRVEVAQVLGAWRAAERQLQGLLEASPMRTRVTARVARLRAEYHRLVAQALR